MKVQVQFPGPDVRLSELPGPDWKAVVFPGPDVRLVEFPPAPTPIVEGIAHFTGSGSARSTLFAVAIIHSAFASEGSASASVFAFGGVKFVDAAFAGVGGLSAASAAAIIAPISGEGVLDSQIASASEMAMSGEGSFAVESTFIGLVAADFASEGTIGASVIAVGGAYDMPANFTGEGSATAKVVPTVTSAFNGSGSASAALASAIKSLFNGSGTNTAKVVSAVKADFTGSGTTSATMVPGFSPSGMTKNASAQTVTSTATQIAGMVAESGSTLSGNSLLPNGSKTGATITAQVSITDVNFSPSSVVVELRKNGVLIPGATLTANTVSGAAKLYTIPTVTANVAGTDQYSLWVTVASGISGITVTAGVNTYVRIT